MQQIISITDLEQLPYDEQIRVLQQLREEYSVMDIRKSMGFESTAHYYAYLKKNNLYEYVVSKRTRRVQEQAADWSHFKDEADSLKNTEFMPDYIDADPGQSIMVGKNLTSEIDIDEFSYRLSRSLNGREVADILERISYFLKGEIKLFDIELVINRSKK